MAGGKSRKIPQRMCVSCREMKARKELFRIVLHEGVPVLDERGKTPGRGAYVCRSATCVEQAFGQNRLRHHLKTEMSAALADEVREALAKHEIELEAEASRARGGRVFRISVDGKAETVGDRNESKADT